MPAKDELPGGSLHDALQNFKRELVRSALQKHGGNKSRAAQELGISRCYMHRLLNQLLGESCTDDESDYARDNSTDLSVEKQDLDLAVRMRP